MVALLLERLQKRPEQLIRIVDLLGVFSQDPDQTRLSLWLFEFLQVGTQGRDDALVRVGVLSEDVLNHQKEGNCRRGSVS